MKKLYLIAGCLFTLIGLAQGGRYFLDYDILSSYGKGFVTGSISFVLLGLVLIYLGYRKKQI